MAMVLIVEDDTMNRDMLARRLSWEGYQVITAADGAQAVEIARAERPALGRTQFAMAQTLWAIGGPEQQQQAIELAKAAAAEYDAYGNRPGNILPRITTWLDLHKLTGTKRHHAR